MRSESPPIDQEKQEKQMETVAVVGASPKPDRYSNKAVNLLKVNGYNVIPVHPAVKEVNGIAVWLANVCHLAAFWERRIQES